MDIRDFAKVSNKIRKRRKIMVIKKYYLFILGVFLFLYVSYGFYTVEARTSVPTDQNGNDCIVLEKFWCQESKYTRSREGLPYYNYYARVRNRCNAKINVSLSVIDEKGHKSGHNNTIGPGQTYTFDLGIANQSNARDILGYKAEVVK